MAIVADCNLALLDVHCTSIPSSVRAIVMSVSRLRSLLVQDALCPEHASRRFFGVNRRSCSYVLDRRRLTRDHISFLGCAVQLPHPLQPAF